MSSEPVRLARELSRAVGSLRFNPPVAHVYNPLDYAWEAHKAYLERYGAGPREVLLVGMNPGPWGMAQTGVPFGEVTLARDWLGLAAPVKRPEREHPKRPVLGFDCPRSEVSGARLWGWAKARFARPEGFFKRFFIHNYCPLMFLEASGKNLTPDKLPAAERAPLEAACDEALRGLVACFKPAFVIGVGAFARDRAQEALSGLPVRVDTILHPSPASPAANRGWAAQAEKGFARIGVSLD